MPGEKHQRTINVVVVSSVALAFISFWRAAAIVLCDLASSAYYVGGISEQAIGKAAPWFILSIMIFSYAVRAVYVEGCTMFTRGGNYRIVKEAMGGTVAKLSVSALMFDYILTGPISAVSAAQYILGLFAQIIGLIVHHDFAFSDQVSNVVTMAIAIAITIYFWRLNIIGVGESSTKALRIMQVTTVMGVLILGWSAVTLIVRHNSIHLPPVTPVMTAESSGWLAGFPRIVGALGIFIAFGHSLLAMSGEESLAQVNREIEAPKLKNLLRAGAVIFVYSLLLTSCVSFLAVLIIPDGKRVATYVVPDGKTLPAGDRDSIPQIDYVRVKGGSQWGYQIADPKPETPVLSDHMIQVGPGTGYHIERDTAPGLWRDNLISGLVQYFAGPKLVRTFMQAFVVIVGFLILAGAVNTSIIGSNGVMNRLAEDGVLTPWFLKPQKKFGTTYRLINMIGVLQLITIISSWGDVNTLGEAYAFGVVWSFVFMTLAMVALRFKDRSPREYEVPLNIRIHRKDKTANTGSPDIDLPVGITIVFLILLSTAALNLLTKKTATIWGIGFTLAFLCVFTVLEYVSHRRRRGIHHDHMEQFNESNTDAISVASLGLTHKNPVIVAVRNPGSLKMLDKILSESDTDRQDIVVVTCKVLPALTQGITPEERTLQDNDRAVLTRVVTLAEETGKQIFPLVIPTNNPMYAIASACRDLKAKEVVLGDSEKMSADMLAEQFALAWGIAQADMVGEHNFRLRVLGENKESTFDM